MEKLNELITNAKRAIEAVSDYIVDNDAVKEAFATQYYPIEDENNIDIAVVEFLEQCYSEY